MFLSLPVCILCSIIMLLLPTHISYLAVNINWFLLRHTELILTISKSSSVYSCDTSCSISLITLFFLLQQTFWNVLFCCTPCMPCNMLGIVLVGGFPHSMYKVVMVWFSVLAFLLYLLLLIWIYLFYQIVLIWSVYLALLLGPSVPLLS